MIFTAFPFLFPYLCTTTRKKEQHIKSIYFNFICYSADVCREMSIRRIFIVMPGCSLPFVSAGSVGLHILFYANTCLFA